MMSCFCAFFIPTSSSFFRRKFLFLVSAVFMVVYTQIPFVIRTLVLAAWKPGVLRQHSVLHFEIMVTTAWQYISWHSGVHATVSRTAPIHKVCLSTYTGSNLKAQHYRAQPDYSHTPLHADTLPVILSSMLGVTQFQQSSHTVNHGIIRQTHPRPWRNVSKESVLQEYYRPWWE